MNEHASIDHQQLHREAIVIDAVCPLLMEKEYIDWYIEGGATAVAPTVASGENAGEALRAVGAWLQYIRARPDLLLVKKAADIETAKAEGKLGVILHFQGTDPLENDVNLLDAYKALGVGMVQLTYNVKNRVGDGASERTDSGLSYFGLAFVERANELGVVVDCSHTGYRTTMDAIEASKAPIVFSHANAKAVHDSPRNITNEQAKAVAATGGLVGIVGFPAFLGPSERPSLDSFVDHIDHYANILGIDHVALGIDYYLGQHLVADEAQAKRTYETMISTGRWRAEAYPPPPHHFPEGIETPRTLPNLTKRLLERGYRREEVEKVLGLNWLRVFRAVWGG